jgi:hypothetical protein
VPAAAIARRRRVDICEFIMLLRLATARDRQCGLGGAVPAAMVMPASAPRSPDIAGHGCVGDSARVMACTASAASGRVLATVGRSPSPATLIAVVDAPVMSVHLIR